MLPQCLLLLQEMLADMEEDEELLIWRMLVQRITLIAELMVLVVAVLLVLNQHSINLFATSRYDSSHNNDCNVVHALCVGYKGG